MSRRRCKNPVPPEEKMACGYLTVPDDRGKPTGPTIRLHVTNFKSTSATPAPDPVFIVAGGAGTFGHDVHERDPQHGRSGRRCGPSGM